MSKKLTQKKTEIDSEETADHIELNNYKIVFLPLTCLQDFSTKTKYDNYFDVAYFSNNGMGAFNQVNSKIFKKNATVILETAKFMIELDKEKVNGFSERICEIAKDICLCKIDTGMKENNETDEKNTLETNNHFNFRNVNK